MASNIIYHGENVLSVLSDTIIDHEKYVNGDPCMFSIAINNTTKKGTLTIGYVQIAKTRDESISHCQFPITEADLK